MKRAAVLALMCLYPATCMATPTGEFVAKWDVLKQNPNHISAEEFNRRPEAQAFIQEFSEAARALKEKINDAKAHNRPAEVCPPAEVKLTFDGILADARQLPAPWQSRPFADSFAQVMKNHYPCPAP